MNRFLLAITVGLPGLLLYVPQAADTQTAMIPLLVMAGVAAVAAAAQGIAGAAQNSENLSAQGIENQKNRDLQVKLAEQQLAEQKRQQQQAAVQGARQGVMTSLQDNVQAANAGQARRQSASDDVMGTLARAYLGRGG